MGCDREEGDIGSKADDEDSQMMMIIMMMMMVMVMVMVLMEAIKKYCITGYLHQ
jgi:hypothetical protein